MLKIENSKAYSKVTQTVIENFNTMTNSAFMKKYSCSKKKYRKRLNRYGDPYMNAPLAKIGKFLLFIQSFKRGKSLK